MTCALATPVAALDLAESIRTRHRQSNIVRAELLADIARFDEMDLAYNFGASSTASWLERELRFKSSTAYEYVAVARKLSLFPQLFDAFRGGDIDYTAVRLLLRYMTPDNEAELVHLASSLCYSELERALAGNDQPDNDPSEPYLKAHVLNDGSLKLEALLPAVEGQQFLAALKIAQLIASGVDVDLPEDVDLSDRLTEPGEFFLDPVPDVEEHCPGEQVREASSTADGGVLGTVSRFGPPEKADLYPALLTMVDMIRSAPKVAARAPGADVTIVMTEDGRAWMPSNPQAPSKVLQHYVSSAMVRCNVLNDEGLTMRFGRRRRYASEAQVRALLSVWGNQCAMPGCAHSRFLQIHHIQDWAFGGSTDIENLIPLCSSCHSKVSHGVASIRQRRDVLEFTFLDGAKFISRNRGLPERVAERADGWGTGGGGFRGAEDSQPDLDGFPRRGNPVWHE